VFPIRARSKFPPLTTDNLASGASNTAETVNAWLKSKKPGWQNCNWGLALGKSGLIVVDVDTAKGGEATIFDLEMAHDDFPETYTVRTPSGGRHLYYKGPHRIALGENGFGLGVDVPNYVLLAGSVTDKGAYEVVNDVEVADAPAWFYEVLGAPKIGHNAEPQAPAVDLDLPAHITWAIDYLKTDAPDCIEGRGGEKTLFDVAAKLKDNGISQEMAVELIDEHYNVPGRCDPLWLVGEGPDADRLDVKVANAYTYAVENVPGSKTAAAEFAADPLPPSNDAETVKEGERKERAGKRETWETLRAGWVHIRQQKRFVRRRDGLMLDKEAFNDAFAYLLPTLRGMGKPPNSMSAAIFNSPPGTMQMFDTFVFMPGEPENYRGAYNQWIKSEIEPKAGDTKLWDAHLIYLFPDEIERNAILDWCAWVYQNQKLHPNHALVVHGLIQGTGKSFISRVLSKLLSSTPATPLSQHTLELDHNGWVLRTKLAICEIRAANKKLTHVLHDLITGPMVHVDAKNMNDCDIPNVLAIYIETNKLDAMNGLDNSDRRYLMVSTDKDGKPLQRRGKDYYRALYGFNGVGGVLNDPVALAAIAHALKTRELAGYSGEDNAPATDAKKVMMDEGAEPIERWMVEHRHRKPYTFSLVKIDEILDDIPGDIRRTSKDPRQEIGRVLRENAHFKGEKLGQVRLAGKHGERVVLWAINRAAMEVSVRQRLTHKQLAAIYSAERRVLSADERAEVERLAAEARADFAGSPL
jgi:hypothetical protein